MQNENKDVIDKQTMEIIQNRQAVLERLRNGETCQQVLNISEDQLWQYYDVASKLMGEGNYSEASDAFFFLSVLSPITSSFWLGIARSERLNNHLEEAIGPYYNVMALEGADKAIFLEAVSCCLDAKKLEHASKMLEVALDYASEHPEDPESMDLYHASTECAEWIRKQGG